MRTSHKSLLAKIKKEGKLTDETTEALKKITLEFIKSF